MLEDRPVVEDVLPHARVANVQQRTDRRVEADLSSLVEDPIRHDAPHGVTEHRLGIALPDEVTGGDPLGDLEERPVEKGRSILDRLRHRVVVVLVEDGRHRLVKELVEHPVAKEPPAVSLLAERLTPGPVQEAGEDLRVQKDVVAELGGLDEHLGIGQVRVPHERPHPPPPRLQGRAEPLRVLTHLIEVRVVVVVVPAEELVCSGSADRDPVPLLGQGLDQKPLDVVADRVNGRVVVPDQRSQPVEEATRLEGDTGVPDAEGFHRVIDQRPLVVPLVRTHDREAVHVMVEDVAGHADQAVGVDAATHQEGQRHVRPQTQPHGSKHSLPDAGHGLLVGQRLGRFVAGPPVALLAACAVRFDGEHRAWPDLPQPDVERRAILIEGLVPVDEVAVQVLVVDGQTAPEQGRDQLDLRAEVDPLGTRIEVKRLLPEAVPAQQKAALGFVVQRKRPHPLTAVEALGTIRGKDPKEHLGVALRAKLAVCPAVGAPKLPVVVDLAVVDDDPRAEAHGLVGPRLEIDDAETGVEQVDAPARGRLVPVETAGVRAPVMHETQTLIEPLLVDRGRSKVTGYSAHASDERESFTTETQRREDSPRRRGNAEKTKSKNDSLCSWVAWASSACPCFQASRC